MRKKTRNYLFTSKSDNYSVLGIVKEVSGHKDIGCHKQPPEGAMTTVHNPFHCSYFPLGLWEADQLYPTLKIRLTMANNENQKLTLALGNMHKKIIP